MKKGAFEALPSLMQISDFKAIRAEENWYKLVTRLLNAPMCLITVTLLMSKLQARMCHYHFFEGFRVIYNIAGEN